MHSISEPTWCGPPGAVRRRGRRRPGLAKQAGAVARPPPEESSGPLRLTIRALEPADVDHLRALFERLSPRSRWLRYLAPVRSLTTSALRRLASIDHEVHEALGAFDEGELVGVAHYFRDAREPGSAPKSASRWPTAISAGASASGC